MALDHCEILANFVHEYRPKDAPAAAPNIKFLYLVPKDVTPRPNFMAVLTSTVTHLRKWIFDAMGNKITLQIEQEPVRKVVTAHPAKWYSTNPSTDSRSTWFWANVATDAFKATGGSFGSKTNITITYIDAMQDSDQAVGGAQGLAVLPRTDIDGLLGLSQLAICRWVGGLGHEFGHAVGLDHPPGCDADQSQKPCKSLMYLGYLTYPDTWLEEMHKKQLKEAPTFGTASLTAPISTVTPLAQWTVVPNSVAQIAGSSNFQKPLWRREPVTWLRGQ